MVDRLVRSRATSYVYRLYVLPCSRCSPDHRSGSAPRELRSTGLAQSIHSAGRRHPPERRTARTPTGACGRRCPAARTATAWRSPARPRSRAGAVEAARAPPADPGRSSPPARWWGSRARPTRTPGARSRPSSASSGRVSRSRRNGHRRPGTGPGKMRKPSPSPVRTADDAGGKGVGRGPCGRAGLRRRPGLLGVHGLGHVDQQLRRLALGHDLAPVVDVHPAAAVMGGGELPSERGRRSAAIPATPRRPPSGPPPRRCSRRWRWPGAH